MVAQRYRTPVQFQRATQTRDAARQLISTYTNLIRTGADVQSVSGRRAVDAGLEETGSGLTVVVRYNPTIASVTLDDRIVINSQNYRIISRDVSFDNTYIRFSVGGVR